MTEWARARSLGKRDDSEPEIIRVFKDAGASIIRHGGKDEPDLFVGYLGVTRAVEIKTAKAKLTPGQVQWHACWQGDPVQVCRSASEAAHLLRVWNVASAVESQRKLVNEMEAP